MPEKSTIRRAQRAKRKGKAPSTQAGEFIREEMRHIRSGEHGARSRKQAIAIGLSKARRAGVNLPDPGSEKVAGDRKSAHIHDYAVKSPKRSKSVKKAMKRMGRPRLRGPEARASAKRGAKTRAKRGTQRGARSRKKK